MVNTSIGLGYRAIARQIIDQGGDYLLALKGNQSNLADEVEAVFSAADGVGYEDYDATEERNHGRHEIRRFWSLPGKDLLVNAGPWVNLNTIGMMESQRTVDGKQVSSIAITLRR